MMRARKDTPGGGWELLRSCSEDSPLIKVWDEYQGDHKDLSQFKFKVVLSYQDALTRQVCEAVKICLRGGGILNSKSEYSISNKYLISLYQISHFSKNISKKDQNKSLTRLLHVTNKSLTGLRSRWHVSSKSIIIF
jgi:hypothetical protein